ncbi:helix-turn-helix domain-containing protein [Hymenobacter sp. AT01-02]|uniref:helix-turn-helix domain-containing protein n=1 Tax=Hymenobacter sp. AT01-02 TaxID=1571877 RepID=UPI00092ED53E
MVDRIREILHSHELTPTQFADAIQVSRPVISHILSGRNKPSLEVVQKIVAAFPDIALSWLLTGSGAMKEAAPAEPVLAQSRTRAPRPATTVASTIPPQPPLKEPETVASATQPLQSEPQPAVVVQSDAEVVSTPSMSARESSTSRVAPTARVSLPQTPAQTPNSDLLVGIAEPGKRIRRIVIFYQDGTFSDYQPEAV